MDAKILHDLGKITNSVNNIVSLAIPRMHAKILHLGK